MTRPPARRTRGPLLVAAVGDARGCEALAAALAVEAAETGVPSLLIEAGFAERRTRATLLASATARELEETLAGTVAGKPLARGMFCRLGLGAGPEVSGGGPEDLDGAAEPLDAAAEALERLPPSAAVVIHVPAALWREALEHPGLRPSAAVLRAELPPDRALVALAVRDLAKRGIRVRIATRGLGWAAGRRALAGVRVGGSEGPRLARWTRLLLDLPSPPRSAPGGSPPSRLQASAGQALPAIIGATAVLLIAALALVSIAGALTGKARVQRTADLAALSAARSMRDDLPRVTAARWLSTGLPNPAHLSRRAYLSRARSAALGAAEANGADRRRVRVEFPDAASFPPLRARVEVLARVEVDDVGSARTSPTERVGSLQGGPPQATVRAQARRSAIPVTAYAVAEATAPAGGAGEMPAHASGGGYSGPLAYRQGEPMRPDVAAAFDRMSSAAARAGLALGVNSGFRSDAEQAALFAANPDPTWVAPPGKSLHRCATELDLGPPAAYGWLAANARRFGFLKRYSWEPWHFGYVAGPAPCSAAGNSGGLAVGGGAPGGGAGSDGRGAGSSGLPGFVPARFRAALLRSAARWNVSAALLAAQLMAESGFDPNAVSPAGAQGIAQFMPSTAAAYGLEDPFDAEASIDGQAHLMSDLLRRLRSVRLALAAYNAGEGAVAGCRCVPPYPETIAYVARVLALLDGAGAMLSPPFEVRLVA